VGLSALLQTPTVVPDVLVQLFRISGVRYDSFEGKYEPKVFISPNSSELDGDVLAFHSLCDERPEGVWRPIESPTALLGALVSKSRETWYHRDCHVVIDGLYQPFP
jgi:hypothetical protein